jgi:hypothetical protein
MIWMINSVLHYFHTVFDFLCKDIVHVEARDQFWNEK